MHGVALLLVCVGAPVFVAMGTLWALAVRTRRINPHQKTSVEVSVLGLLALAGLVLLVTGVLAGWTSRHT